MPAPTPDCRLAVRTPLSRPPRFTVGWHDAIFEHFRIADAAAVEARLPAGLQLDRHAGDAYLSVVSFRMASMRWRGWRLPFSHTYPQINVRVYVHHDGVPGVFFLRNYVGHRLAAWAGRRMYGMPYVHQPVALAREGDAYTCAADIGGERHRIEGRAAAPCPDPLHRPDTLPFFLVERYPLYSQRSALQDRLVVAHMFHPPWPLHRLVPTARSWAIPAQLGLRGALERLDTVHCSPGVDVQMWGAVDAAVSSDTPASMEVAP